MASRETLGFTLETLSFGKPDSRLSKGEDVVATGSKNRACASESREDHGKSKWRDPTSTRRDEQHGQGRNNGDS